MPSTVTHAYFALDVFHMLPKDIQDKFPHFDNIKIYSQNMDVLFFYNILNFRQGKKVRDFGHYFHCHKTNDFFISLIHYIKRYQLENDWYVMLFLYGMICHFCLDSFTHPFIIYKSGNFDRKDKTTYKYNHLHGEIETLIDNYFILKRECSNPYHFKAYQFCFPFDFMNNNLKRLLDDIYLNVFDISNMGQIYYDSVQQMKLFFHIFRYDPYGIKKAGYHLIDGLFPKFFLRKSVLSYHLSNKKTDFFLNLNHKKWCHPTVSKLTSRSSFLDLYIEAQNKAVFIINRVNDYLYYNRKVNFENIFQNRSYVTGLDCDIEQRLKHFEF